MSRRAATSLKLPMSDTISSAGIARLLPIIQIPKYYIADLVPSVGTV